MWQDGQGVARRSRDGKEQAAEGMTKMQHPCGFHMRRLPLYFPPPGGGLKIPTFATSQKGGNNPRTVVATYPRELSGAVSLPCLHLTGEVARGCVTEGEIRKEIRRCKKQQGKKSTVVLRGHIFDLQRLSPPCRLRLLPPLVRWGQEKNPHLHHAVPEPWWLLPPRERYFWGGRWGALRYSRGVQPAASRKTRAKVLGSGRPTSAAMAEIGRAVVSRRSQAARMRRRLRAR